MKKFLTIWAGQLLSTMGTGITGFAVGVWVFRQNGSATEFAIISFCVMLPGIVISPFAGVLADKLKRKTIILLADTGAALTTLALALIITYGELHIWHIYATSLLRSSFNAFQWPSYAASIAMIVPKAQLGRASGMTQLAAAMSRLISPVAGGFLLLAVDLNGIFIIDLATYAVAFLTLIFIDIPQPDKKPKAAKKAGEPKEGGLMFGLRYINSRPGLTAMLIFFCMVNFLMGNMLVLAQPMILSFTDAKTLGTMLSIAGFGMVLGSLAMSIWGGPKDLILGVFGFQMITAVGIFISGLAPSVVLITVGAFMFFFAQPITMGCSQVLWQRAVPKEYQGRVFGMRRSIGGALVPASFLLAGPTADFLFEPLMVEGGVLAGSLGSLIGTGPGRGIALMFSILGICLMIMTIVGYSLPAVRTLAREAMADAKDESKPDAASASE